MFEWYDTFPYLSMIGAALYLAINTRPDIMFAVCLLARYSRNKPYAACIALAHMYSYIYGTTELGVTYNVGPFQGADFETMLDMFGMSDADFAGDLRTRRSTSGFVVYMAGGPYAWGSKLMSTIAASTQESEYMSAYYLGQQLLYARGQLKELRLKLKRPSPFFMDAMAAINGLKNPMYHARTKHVDIKFKWLAQHFGIGKAV